MSQSELSDTAAVSRRTSPPVLSRTAAGYRWGVSAIGAIALVTLVALNPPADIRYFLVFTVAAIFAEAALTVRVAPGSRFRVGTTFLFVYFLLAGGIAAAALQAFLTVSVDVVRRFRKGQRRRFIATAFEVGQAVLAVFTGALATRIAFGEPALTSPVIYRPISSLVVFAFVYYVTNLGLASLAVYTRAGWTELRDDFWRRTARWAAISIGTALPFAILMRLAAPTVGAGASALLILLLLSGIALVLKLNVNLRAGNDDLKTINRIGTLISASLEQATLFKILARESRRVLKWDSFFIALADRDAEDVQLIFFDREGNDVGVRRIPRGSGLTGRAIDSGELIYYERGKHEALDSTESTSRGVSRPRSMVVVPMKFGDTVIGAISVQSQLSDAFGESALRFLQTVAGQAAIAIRNAQLFQSEQRARIERDEFLSLVTHEIKNPLTSVLGYTDVARIEFEEGNQKGAFDSLEVIRNESRRILRLAEDLLDASRMDAGRFSMQLEPVDLARVVEDVVARYAATAKHEIVMQIQDVVPQITGDPTRLAQVFENLVSNAVKYSPEPAPITVSVERKNELVQVSIRDRGIGIPPEKLQLVFERYYRVEEGGQVIKGTGIGLYVAREIARMHGGEIKASSEPGSGSTFTVLLPITGPQRSADPQTLG